MRNVMTIAKKEIAAFLNSLTAYLVIIVFLVGTGCFFWIFEFNVLETGYATLDPLFEYGPYMFLLLIPSITMRAFSEEMKSGTMEFLITKPLTDWEIILGKYVADIVLVAFALLPTLLYVGTIYWLGDPVGNLDIGATIGSYIGLFAFGCIFTSIGLFTSSVTQNQIIAFVFGLFLCFFLFIGLEFVAGIGSLNSWNEFLLKMSISAHYRSISRGVIDLRDVLYFVSVVIIFLIATKLMLNRKRI